MKCHLKYLLQSCVTAILFIINISCTIIILILNCTRSVSLFTIISLARCPPFGLMDLATLKQGVVPVVHSGADTGQEIDPQMDANKIAETSLCVK